MKILINLFTICTPIVSYSQSSKQALDTIYWQQSIQSAEIKMDSSTHYNAEIVKMLKKMDEENYFDKPKNERQRNTEN